MSIPRTPPPSESHVRTSCVRRLGAGGRGVEGARARVLRPEKLQGMWLCECRLLPPRVWRECKCISRLGEHSSSIWCCRGRLLDQIKYYHVTLQKNFKDPSAGLTN